MPNIITEEMIDIPDATIEIGGEQFVIEHPTTREYTRHFYNFFGNAYSILDVFKGAYIYYFQKGTIRHKRLLTIMDEIKKIEEENI